MLDKDRPDQLRGLPLAMTNHHTRNQMLWKLPRSQWHQRISGITHRWFRKSLGRNEWSETIREPLHTSPPAERAPHSGLSWWSADQQVTLPGHPCPKQQVPLLGWAGLLYFSGSVCTWLTLPVIPTLCLQFALPPQLTLPFTQLERKNAFMFSQSLLCGGSR